MKNERWVPRIACLAIFLLLVFYSAKFFARIHVPWVFRMADSIYPNPWPVGIPVSHKYWLAPYSPMIYATLILLFLLAFFFRKKINRGCSSITAGFLLSFLVEMYGVAFSTYALHSIMGQPAQFDRFSPPSQAILFNHILRFPSLVLGWTVGIFIIWTAWNEIHRGRDGLVTSGIYARIRHPQYVGLFFIALGVLVFCPTPMQLLLFIILITMYARLSRLEDADMERLHGEEFLRYRREVPAFFPRWRPCATSPGAQPSRPAEGG